MSLCESITEENRAFESFESRSRSPRGRGNPYARTSSAHSQSPLIHPAKAADMRRGKLSFSSRGKRVRDQPFSKGNWLFICRSQPGDSCVHSSARRQAEKEEAETRNGSCFFGHTNNTAIKLMYSYCKLTLTGPVNNGDKRAEEPRSH